MTKNQLHTWGSLATKSVSNGLQTIKLYFYQQALFVEIRVKLGSITYNDISYILENRIPSPPPV